VSIEGCSTVLRGFAGPAADEIALLCRPEGGSSAAGQADAAYRAAAATLAAQHASFASVVRETLFLRDIARDLPPVLAARARILADLGQADAAPRPTFIGQAPVESGRAFEMAAWSLVPRDPGAWSVEDVAAEPSCACAGCARSGARLVRLGDLLTLHSTNLYGTGGDAYAQARGMFAAAERLLERCGMTFRDVVRTWIHLRDIDRDYDALNRARRDFFQASGIARRPASTGVQGIPFPGVHDVSLTLQAVRSPRPLDVAGMSTPLLNEAWTYGADFSRGLRLVEASRVALHVSGTASIGEDGRTVHAGEFAAQADRMLHNITSLLAGQGATQASLVSGVTYLKRASDAPALRAAWRRHGFGEFPCAVVEAGLCRPELLCEAEVIALLPQTGEGA
jgi:enamine deaminase RidA (YjgF/YER057c/UK114 family)